MWSEEKEDALFFLSFRLRRRRPRDRPDLVQRRRHGAAAVTYGYDAAGNLTSAANGAGAYTYAYDALDRTTPVQEPFGLSLTYAYDAAGNRTLTQDSQGGATTSVFDAANEVTSLQFGGTAAPLRIDLTYTARGQVATETRYSDLAGTTKVGSTSYAYDAVGRVSNIQHHNGDGVRCWPTTRRSTTWPGG